MRPLGSAVIHGRRNREAGPRAAHYSGSGRALDLTAADRGPVVKAPVRGQDLYMAESPPLQALSALLHRAPGTSPGSWVRTDVNLVVTLGRDSEPGVDRRGAPGLRVAGWVWPS